MTGIATALLRFLLTLGIVLAAAVYFLQDRLLYYPEAIEPTAALARAGELRLKPWPHGAAAQDVRGWWRETSQPARGTVVLFHGNAGHALHRSWYADELERLGYRTLLAEYPGYGQRPGDLGETSLVADAVSLIADLRRELGADQPLFVAGESLGAGVAAAAFARDATPGIDGIMLITPWNDLASVAGHHYPLLPVRLVMRDRYDTVANLRGFRGPVVVLLAEGDDIVPPAFGRRLFSTLASERKKLIELPNCGHNDWNAAMTPARWQEALDFMAGK